MLSRTPAQPEDLTLQHNHCMSSNHSTAWGHGKRPPQSGGYDPEDTREMSWRGRENQNEGNTFKLRQSCLYAVPWVDTLLCQVDQMCPTEKSDGYRMSLRIHTQIDLQWNTPCCSPSLAVLPTTGVEQVTTTHTGTWRCFLRMFSWALR